jgi:hypothetical protein
MVAVLEVSNMSSSAELEYKTLLDMMLKCIDTRDHIMQINTALVAGLLVLATTKDFPLHLVLIYPPISTMLAAIWARNTHHSNLIELYLRTRLSVILNPEWDTWRWRQQIGSKLDIEKQNALYIILSEFSLFFAVQIIMILIGTYSIDVMKLTFFDEVLT